MELKEQMTKEFIPTIEEMIEKESMHLAYLMDAKTKISKKESLLSIHPQYEIDLMIGRSSISLNHLRSRLLEYNEYVGRL